MSKAANALDHGGGLDAAVDLFGGRRADWLDLSTGLNPVPYPVEMPPGADWAQLPDRDAEARLNDAARRFWRVPQGAGILAAPGASALIARIPGLAAPGRVQIPGPTYNEHAAAFSRQGWTVTDEAGAAAQVLVNPNNPDGRSWARDYVTAPLCVIDESFCDVAPDRSLVGLADRPGVLVLKSFGKFWGLAGLRLGFAIGDPALLAQLASGLGPWPVSGPALRIGTTALQDESWAKATRLRLDAGAARLDVLMTGRGARLAGGTPLFRLYQVDDAHAWQHRLARHHVWSRVFPYSATWLRLGLPTPEGWARLETAI